MQIDGTRRAAFKGAEQKYSLPEQPRTEPGRWHGSAQAVEQEQQRGQAHRPLLPGVRRQHRGGGIAGAARTPGFAHEQPETHQQRPLRRFRPGQPRPVAVQHREVQVSRGRPSYPLADRRPGYIVRTGHLRHRSPLPELGNRGEDGCDVVGLSRQNIAGKDSLASLALHATRQADQQPDVTIRHL